MDKNVSILKIQISKIFYVFSQDFARIKKNLKNVSKLNYVKKQWIKNKPHSSSDYLFV